jgi:hypothetical protein
MALRLTHVRLVRLVECCGGPDLRGPRYPRRMGESTGAPLTPEQRERMQRAILAELRRIRDEALAAGVPPATIDRVVEERRRALDTTEDPS